MDTNSKHILEAMIDLYGLAKVLNELGEICGEKAVHIAANWQDTATAKPWAKACTMIDSAANRVTDLRI